jgi:cephalosporin hydroxylase
MVSLLKKKISELSAYCELLGVKQALQDDSRNLPPQQLVNLLYSARWERFFWIKQLKDEILSLVKVVSQTQPRIIVEIGSNMGGTLFLFTKVAAQDAIIFSLDLPGGMGGGGYPWYRAGFYRSFATGSQRIHLLRGDSHDKSLYDQLVRQLEGKAIDFLFLDGDHSFDGIKMDFEMYGPLVKPGGLIAFHDIKPSMPDNWRQVGPFWQSIKSSYDHFEFLSEEDTWGGIGLIKV